MMEYTGTNYSETCHAFVNSLSTSNPKTLLLKTLCVTKLQNLERAALSGAKLRRSGIHADGEVVGEVSDKSLGCGNGHV